nr:Maf family protein [Robiginitomaculum antarcticum]
MPSITLASGSVIRRRILNDAGVTFEVITKPVDEAAIKTAMLAEGARLRDIADALAEAKSVRVSRNQDGLVIGADQIMVFEDRLYDKPQTLDEARARLLALRGKTHYLIGAAVISENGSAVWRHISKTKLTMRDFSDSFLDGYLEAGGEDLLTSVGAYKFEGLGAQLFSAVDGDFFSILGLSLLPVLDYLRIRGAIAS